MSIEKGIALYTKEKDGCLTGVYTNEKADGVLSNEIAIKFPQENNVYLEGTYSCYYFQNGVKEGYKAVLKIEIDNKSKTKRMYKFTWLNEMNNPIFEGTGYFMNEKQIAVSYNSFTK